MTNEKKLELITEMLEMDEGVLCADTILSELDEWDSMAKLSLIVLMDEEFGKKLTGAQIKAFNTMQDILNFMD